MLPKLLSLWKVIIFIQILRVRPGYSGTAVISKIKELNVIKGINKAEHDTEGRVLCLEMEPFFLVNVYVPNSGSELKRLGYRQDWDKAFFHYLKNLEKVKACNCLW